MSWPAKRLVCETAGGLKNDSAEFKTSIEFSMATVYSESDVPLFCCLICSCCNMSCSECKDEESLFEVKPASLQQLTLGRRV